MRLIILLVILASSCATKPVFKLPAPKIKGNFYTHNVNLNVAFGSEIGTGKEVAPVPIKDTDKWIMLPPETYKSFKNNHDALKAACGY